MRRYFIGAAILQLPSTFAPSSDADEVDSSSASSSTIVNDSSEVRWESYKIE